jgi:hypothetical protein
MRVNDLEDKAKEAAGNWQHFDSFYCDMSDWEEDGIDPSLVTTVYTSNRDSGLLDQSNAEAIEKTLEPYLDNRTARSISHNHWACGHVDGYEILVYDKDGAITPAFREWWDICKSLEDYPVLDEEDYSSKEFDATCENIEEAISSFAFNHDDFERWRLPDDIASVLFSWFWDNDQSAVENGEDQGGYPSDEQIENALTVLGYYIEEGQCTGVTS